MMLILRVCYCVLSNDRDRLRELLSLIDGESDYDESKTKINLCVFPIRFKFQWFGPRTACCIN